MSTHTWFFSLRLWPNPESPDMTRVAVAGPAHPSTIKTALHLAGASEELRAKICSDTTVRKFVEGALDSTSNGYYVHSSAGAAPAWVICIASIHKVL